MIDQHTIFEIHRLHHEGFSNRKIAGQVGIGRDAVSKYLKDPNPVSKQSKKRGSKLDGFCRQIDQMLNECPDVNAVVVQQRLEKLGYTGEITLVRNYLRQKRGSTQSRQSYIRFESEPGQQMQVDWGHFGSIDYQNTRRKLYGLIVVESYSRLMTAEFTHSQKQETLHQCLFNAFRFFGGTPRELVVDNMTTAVIERQGKIIRFNDRFLSFLRPFTIVPYACNVRAAHEKGKVERSIGYLKKSFIPLRTFKDLDDIREQVRDWLSNVANKRIHQTTGEVPEIRAGKLPLTSLPFHTSDPYMETVTVAVYKDFSVRFDANSYTTPPWCIGKRLTLKADQKVVKLFHKDRLIASHLRSWERKKRIEHPRHVEEAKKHQQRVSESKEVKVFKSLGEEFREFLIKLTQSDQPIQKSLNRLLDLKDQYGKGSLAWAIQKALRHNAIGADYIENILYQEMTPESHHLPVRTKDQHLNEIRLHEPCLADYDALILKRK